MLTARHGGRRSGAHAAIRISSSLRYATLRVYRLSSLALTGGDVGMTTAFRRRVRRACRALYNNLAYACIRWHNLSRRWRRQRAGHRCAGTLALKRLRGSGALSKICSMQRRLHLPTNFGAALLGKGIGRSVAGSDLPVFWAISSWALPLRSLWLCHLRACRMFCRTEEKNAAPRLCNGRPEQHAPRGLRAFFVRTPFFAAGGFYSARRGRRALLSACKASVCMANLLTCHAGRILPALLRAALTAA